jgi:hypothetical protein
MHSPSWNTLSVTMWQGYRTRVRRAMHAGSLMDVGGRLPAPSTVGFKGGAVN